MCRLLFAVGIDLLAAVVARRLQVDRVLDSSHTESTYKTAVVQTTWQKEAGVLLKRLVNTRKHGLQYAEPFLTPVDPIACVGPTGGRGAESDSAGQSDLFRHRSLAPVRPCPSNPGRAATLHACMRCVTGSCSDCPVRRL